MYIDMPRKQKVTPCVKPKKVVKAGPKEPQEAAENFLDFVLGQIKKDSLPLLQAMNKEQLTALLASRDTEAVIGEVTNVLSYWMPTSAPSPATPTPAPSTSHPLLNAETHFLTGVNKVMIKVLADYGPLPYSVLAGWFYLVANKYSQIHSLAYPLLCQSSAKK